MPRPNGSADLLSDRRRRALALLKSGLSLNEVARRIQCVASSVMRWRNAWRRRGEDAFKVGASPGRPLKLKASQQRRLLRLLRKGPLAQGYNTNVWTTARIAEVTRPEPVPVSTCASSMPAQQNIRIENFMHSLLSPTSPPSSRISRVWKPSCHSSHRWSLPRVNTPCPVWAPCARRCAGHTPGQQRTPPRAFQGSLYSPKVPARRAGRAGSRVSSASSSSFRFLTAESFVSLTRLSIS